ncbi:MAG: hypothetical protein CL467_05410 [Acidimicrobiaceae bacterium]|nr:hypothetical protein [Acidimicrobiaceae bacterium]
MAVNTGHRAILVHDFEESNRRGMLDGGSRYLLSLGVFKSGLEAAIDHGVVFDEIGGPDPGTSGRVEITSDDGGGSALLLAEYLAGQGLRATFFIVTDWIGRENFLDRDEIRAIRSMGHVVGSHSHTHSGPFCDLPEVQLRDEVLESKGVLEELLGVEVDTFSVPGGEIRPATIRRLESPELGLSRIYTSTPRQGVYRSRTTAKVIGRYCIEAAMGQARIVRIFSGQGWERNRMRYLAGRAKREVWKAFSIGGTTPRREA